MNESVYRSPKWMRNFADFEVNTGDDIKGEPSKRRQRQLDEEEREKEEKRQEKIRQEKKRSEYAKEFLKAEKKREHKKMYMTLFNAIKKYIFSDYDKCDLKVVSENIFKISKENSTYSGKKLDFSVILDNSVVKPTFKVVITYDGEYFNYTSSGTIHQKLKDFIVRVVYPYYTESFNKKKSNNYKSKYDSDYGYDKSKKSYKKKKTSGNYYKKKTTSPPKNEKDPDKNRLRRYKLLKSTLEGYIRQMDEIKRWEKVHKQSHSDRVATENELNAVKRRIEQMNKDYSYEKLNYDFIELNFVEIQNRINIIKNDLGMYK